MPKSEKELLKDAEVGKKPPEGDYKALAKQIQSEYELSWKHQNPKKKEWELRLKLYNNQRRDKKAVGDTTMFTIFQTVLSSLYVDRLMVEFGGREEGDEEVAESLNAMAEYDYVAMEKDEIDFDWIWDTLFFGRGIVSLCEYKRDPDNGVYLPLPEVWDPITFLRDPRAVSINGKGTKGTNAARFFGGEVKMTKKDIKDHPHIFDSDFRGIKLGTGTRSLLKDAREARDTAQGRQSQRMMGEENLGVNAEYDITRWFTHWEVKGKVERVKVWLAADRNKVIGIQVFKKEEDGSLAPWAVIDRPLYPTAHDWDGTSIPDLTEDKQRARAVLQNLGLKAMKADLHPMYAFDSNKITNRNDLNFGFDKFIPIDKAEGNVMNAISPIIKSRPDLGLLDFIYSSLEISAQKASATPELKQGMLSDKDRTLGEINLASAESDTRYSLSAKVFGWSEKRFWIQWYRLYKDNFESNIDEKILRLKGAFGPKWRPLRRKNIIGRIDPDVTIESKVLSRAKQLEERASLTQYFGLALQEPTSNRRWGLKKLATLNGLEKDEIDRLFPPTIDERIAEDQNELLSKNQTVPVLPEDDHNVHLEMHSKAGDTNATFAHIETHKEALSYKKVNPEAFPEEPEATAFQAPGTERLSPVGSAATPRSIAPNQAPGASVSRA